MIFFLNLHFLLVFQKLFANISVVTLNFHQNIRFPTESKLQLHQISIKFKNTRHQIASQKSSDLT